MSSSVYQASTPLDESAVVARAPVDDLAAPSAHGVPPGGIPGAVVTTEEDPESRRSRTTKRLADSMVIVSESSVAELRAGDGTDTVEPSTKAAGDTPMDFDLGSDDSDLEAGVVPFATMTGIPPGGSTAAASQESHPHPSVDSAAGSAAQVDAESGADGDDKAPKNQGTTTHLIGTRDTDEPSQTGMVLPQEEDDQDGGALTGTAPPATSAIKAASACDEEQDIDGHPSVGAHTKKMSLTEAVSESPEVGEVNRGDFPGDGDPLEMDVGFTGTEESKSSHVKDPIEYSTVSQSEDSEATKLPSKSTDAKEDHQ